MPTRLRWRRLLLRHGGALGLRDHAMGWWLVVVWRLCESLMLRVWIDGLEGRRLGGQRQVRLWDAGLRCLRERAGGKKCREGNCPGPLLLFGHAPRAKGAKGACPATREFGSWSALVSDQQNSVVGKELAL